MNRFSNAVIVGVFTLLASVSAYAAHPLITDDTGTQGKGKFQLEVNGAYSRNSADGIVERVTDLGMSLTYGVTDRLDVAVGIPYQHISVHADGNNAHDSGLSDIALNLKWRFCDSERMSFALKSGVTLPTGDDERGLGAGRATYSIFFITTRELNPLTFHLNLGYIRKENEFDKQKDIWHASLASEISVAKDLRLVSNIGIERTAEKNSGIHPAFFLVGFIYGVADDLDIDGGIKFALNRAEPDYQILAGVVYRF